MAGGVGTAVTSPMVQPQPTWRSTVWCQALVPIAYGSCQRTV
jgi:hypothetical protein